MDFLALVKEYWDEIVALFDKLYNYIKSMLITEGE